MKHAPMEPLAISIEEAANLSSISRRTLYNLLRDGAIQSRKVGRRRLVIVRSLRAYLEHDDAEAASPRGRIDPAAP